MSWLKKQVSNQSVQDEDSMSAAVAAAAFAIHTLEENGSDHSQPSDTKRSQSFKKMRSIVQPSMKKSESPDRTHSSRPTRSSSSNKLPTPEHAPEKAARNGKPKWVLSWAKERTSKATTKSGSRNIIG